MQTITCNCGTKILYVDNVEKMQKAIRKHLTTCTGKPRSFPEAQYYLLMKKVIAVKISDIAQNSFHVAGGCSGHLKQTGGLP